MLRTAHAVMCLSRRERRASVLFWGAHVLQPQFRGCVRLRKPAEFGRDLTTVVPFSGHTAAAAARVYVKLVLP